MPGPKKKRRERAQAARRRTGQRPARPGRPRPLLPWPTGPAAQGPGVAQATPAAPEARPAAAGDGPADGAPGWMERILQEILTVTYWFDPGEHGEPYLVTIWFSGRRAGVAGKPKPGDTLTREETYEGIVPGSGPVALTAEVRGINPGKWTVTARPVARVGSRMTRPHMPAGNGSADGRRRAPWPRRVVIPAAPPAPVSTALLPFTKIPGIIRFAYTALVLLGCWPGWACRQRCSPAPICHRRCAGVFGVRTAGRLCRRQGLVHRGAPGAPV